MPPSMPSRKRQRKPVKGSGGSVSPQYNGLAHYPAGVLFAVPLVVCGVDCVLGDGCFGKWLWGGEMQGDEGRVWWVRAEPN